MISALRVHLYCLMQPLNLHWNAEPQQQSTMMAGIRFYRGMKSVSETPPSWSTEFTPVAACPRPAGPKWRDSADDDDEGRRPTECCRCVTTSRWAGGLLNPDSYQLQIAGKAARGHDPCMTSMHVNTPPSSEAWLSLQIAIAMTVLVVAIAGANRSAQNRRLVIFFSVAPQLKPTSKTATDGTKRRFDPPPHGMRHCRRPLQLTSATVSTVRRDNNYATRRAVYYDIMTYRWQASDSATGG